MIVCRDMDFYVHESMYVSMCAVESNECMPMWYGAGKDMFNEK